MKLVTYQYDDRQSIGLVHEDMIIDLSDIASDMLSFIELGPVGSARAREIAESPSTLIPLAEVRLMAPIPVPRRNIMCLGKNYAEHARESQEARGEQVAIPDYPVIFTKATTSVNGPFDDVPLDLSVSSEMDYEVELAVIIGRRGRNIRPEDAMDYVFGYTVLNDITARDLQTRHKQFFKGKSLDGCCPIGPRITTSDDIADPHDLRITCTVNGELRQDSSTVEMIYRIPTIITELSRGMTLLPGDIIATGTPSGVGFARKPPVFLQPGDIVECAVEGIGMIRNRMISA